MATAPSVSLTRQGGAVEFGSWQRLLSLLEEHPEPEGSYPVPGFANIDDFDAVVNSGAWKLIAEQEEAAGPICAPTTLGRVDRSIARHLIARGYANTYLASLYLAPLRVQDPQWLERLPDRLTKIVPNEDEDRRRPQRRSTGRSLMHGRWDLA